MTDSTLYSDEIALIIILVSLVLSFFFSGSETAFVSVNKVRVELWRRRNLRQVKYVLDFLRNPEKFLYTTLVGNNIFNVAFASVATLYFHNFIDRSYTWLLVVVLTLFFGEILPKTVFRSLANWLVRKIALPLYVFYYLFYPLIWIISKISELLLSLMGHQKDEVRLFFSKKDIEILLSEGHEVIGRKDPEGGEFLKAILSFRAQWVREAMVPRTEMIAVPDTISLEELQKIFETNGFTKLPVYRESPDDIIGVVYLKDLFLNPERVNEIVREAYYVPETKRCSDLLSEFRQNQISIAIVIDEYGGTAGLITTEDLVEELVGEIEDEFDDRTELVYKIDEHTYRVNARAEIDRLNQELPIRLPEGEYETLSGFILSHLGSIPRRDSSFEYQGVRFLVTRASRRKIEWVRIILPRE